MDFYSNVCFAMTRNKLFPYQVGTHVHNCFELIYYIEGTGLTTINGVEYPYSDHVFCIIPPQVRHEEVSLTPTHLLYIGFEYDNKLGELGMHLMRDENGAVLNWMLMIAHEMTSRGILYEQMIQLHQKSLVIELHRLLMKATATRPNTNKKLVEYAVNFILSNYPNAIDLNSLANSIGYSYDRFRHLFKEIYGISAQRFILNTRISHAKELLLNTDESVDAISQLCGFCSSSQFIVTFKKYTGTTPHQYRRQEEHYIEKADYIQQGAQSDDEAE